MEHNETMEVTKKIIIKVEGINGVQPVTKGIFNFSLAPQHGGSKVTMVALKSTNIVVL